jgi:hypothetical protein
MPLNGIGLEKGQIVNTENPIALGYIDASIPGACRARSWLIRRVSDILVIQPRFVEKCYHTLFPLFPQPIAINQFEIGLREALLQ